MRIAVGQQTHLLGIASHQLGNGQHYYQRRGTDDQVCTAPAKGSNQCGGSQRYHQLTKASADFD